MSHPMSCASNRPSQFVSAHGSASSKTCGATVLHGAIHGTHIVPFTLGLALLRAFCLALFAVRLRNIRRRWIV